jgi:hypothetical protein
VSQFKVTWSQALDLLERELFMLDGEELVLEIDVREQDLRLDGMLRANARADQPAVIVAFESVHGPLLYRSDQYEGAPSWRRGGMQEGWQHNVYAVALTLEALRSVDRYGATRSGEQYRGYRQIGGAPAIVPDAPLDLFGAARVVAAAAEPMLSGAGLDNAARILMSGGDELAAAVRQARRFAHPDTGGSTDAFQRVEAAVRVLRGAR